MSGDDSRYDGVLRALSDMAQEWRIYRDTINRAINLLNHEVLDLSRRFDKDDAARLTRQQQIDAKMESIIVGQEQIKRWQAIRLGIELAAILIIAAFLYGASHR
jgi:hypothetical protein